MESANATADIKRRRGKKKIEHIQKPCVSTTTRLLPLAALMLNRGYLRLCLGLWHLIPTGSGIFHNRVLPGGDDFGSMIPAAENLYGTSDFVISGGFSTTLLV